MIFQQVSTPPLDLRKVLYYNFFMANAKIRIETQQVTFPDPTADVFYNVSSGFPLHTHEGFWEIVIFVRDCREYFNGSFRECKASDCCIVRPQDVHSYPDKSQEIILYNLKITSQALQTLLDMYDVALYPDLVKSAQPLHHLPMDMAKRMIKRLSSLPLIVNQNNKEACIKAIIATLIQECFIFPFLSRTNTPDRSVAIYPLNEIISRLSNPSYVEGDLGTLLNGLGYSIGHLSRLFKVHLGVTIGKYFLDAKINYSASLLTHTDMSILQIANAIGYANQSNFGKVFREKFGLSPLEYRKRNPTQ